MKRKAEALKIECSAQDGKKEIFFKAKMGIRELSNFYGDGELMYQEQRFPHKKQAVPKLLRALDERCKNARIFVNTLKKLQPQKKWTVRKEKHWFHQGEPIRGIIAKLVVNMIKRVLRKDSGWKKEAAILIALGQDQGINIREKYLHMNTGKEIDKQFMRNALFAKFSKQKYRDLLLSTGDCVLHEYTRSRSPDRWCLNKHGDGEDILGKLLMEVRERIKFEDIKRTRTY